MPLPHVLEGHAERLIASGRLVLASASLLALWLDPSQPASHADITFGLLAMYTVYAAVVAGATWRSHLPSPRGAMLAHALDLAVFWLLIYFTEGPTSPFFVYFVFAIGCAAIRWGWRGTLWTTLVALASFTGLSVYAAEIAHDPRFELNRSIIRAVHLAIIAVFLARLAAHERRRRGQIARLAAWPRTMTPDAAAVVRETLADAASTLGAPRALLLWEASGEPGLHLASWSAGEFRSTREPPGAFDPPVARELAGRHFVCRDARSPGPVLLDAPPGEPQPWAGVPVHPRLRERFAIGPALCLAVRGESLDGWLFALDGPVMAADMLDLGEVVAQRVAERLDLLHLVQRLRQAAATEAQIRLARDLHDGLLQSLTGVALQLETVRRLLEAEPATARERLREIQRVISAEQRDLRGLVRQLQPAGRTRSEAPVDVAARLEELRHRLERQWGLRVELSTDGVEKGLSGPLAREVYLLLHEALINVARHAGASSARVTMGIRDDRLAITVADDGVGFRFKGHYDHAALTALNLGPASLHARAAALGGALAIDSSDAGARLAITLPLSSAAAADAAD